MEQGRLVRTRFAQLLFVDARLAPLWAIVRLYVGYQWLLAGWGKLVGEGAAAWIGERSGVAVMGFARGALAKTDGEHPDVQGWYASFLQEVVMPNPAVFSHMVAFGEICVGVALVAGFLVGISAFFGAFMNLNYLLSGSVSINPVLLIVAILLILAWRTAGRWGMDRWVLPLIFDPRGAGGAPYGAR